MRFKILCLILFAAAAVSVRAQNESKLGADFRGEGQRFQMDCEKFSFSSFLSCAELLFTDHPLHIAVGSIAPENGFGAGAAFVSHANPEKCWHPFWPAKDDPCWRLSWDVDAIASSNGSWRAGAYMKAIYTGAETEQTTHGRPTNPPSSNPADGKKPYFNLYAQAISLNKIDYFGLGPATTTAGRTYFGEREIVPGVDGVFPIAAARWLNLSLYGEANGRLVAIRGSQGQTSPSIEQLYTDTTAPGLNEQPGFAQFGEGVRLQPSYGDHVQLNYFVELQEFIAPGDSQFSFRRFTADLTHEFPIYHKRAPGPLDHNGPDDCSAAPDDPKCPSARTFDRVGSFAFRLLISESTAPAGHVVPFYFQPTLGGDDLNSNPSLMSFQDYRFRAPNLILLHESFEHSIYGLLGFNFGVDEGKVAMTRDGVDFGGLLHSFSVGLNLRAGGFPQVVLSFAWGGSEGTHTIGMMNTSLLGGAARPPLF